jgi:hypothetical protein
LTFSAAVGQSPDSRMNGQNVPLEQVTAGGGPAVATACMTGAGDAGVGAEAAITAGSLAATAAAIVLPLPFSAAVAQSPDSRTNGQNVPLVQVVAFDGGAAATAAGAACCGLIATGTGAGMLLLVSVTQVSLTIGQSQLRLHVCADGALNRAMGVADVFPLAASAAVGQSPSSRTNGHKIPL